MDRIPYGSPPRWWGPKLRPWFIRFLGPPRRVRMRRREGLQEVDVQGLDNLRQALAQGDGVLVTSNHAGHADAFVFLIAGDRLGVPFYYMVAWQTLHLLGPVGRGVLRRHGCFSVDREANDFRAFRRAVEILRRKRNPLVMFPEGEIYHNCYRLHPFRTGTAAIALTAARAADRRVVCVPAAIKYRYAHDPTPLLNPVVDALERRLSWQPRRDLPLERRLRRVADGYVALKELEYRGEVREGPFSDRTLSLADAILRRLEARYPAAPRETTIPERVTALRRQAVPVREASRPGEPEFESAERDLEDIAVAVQLYSYADDYEVDRPSIEHLAEVVDKLEEDILGAPTATVRGVRRAVIRFGEPLEVSRTGNVKEQVPILTEVLHARVRELLGETHFPRGWEPAIEEPAEESERELAPLVADR